MIEVVSVYDDVVKDDVHTAQNGDLTYEMFNRISKRAELRLLNFLTGNSTGDAVPQIYSNQKNKDWLSIFITKFPAQVKNGSFTRPTDYYLYDNLYRIGSKINQDCGEDIEGETDEANTPIEIVNGDVFNDRMNTYIDELKVSISKPISKMFGNEFEVAPKDIGSVCLEYIRFPKYASITPVNDPVYNIEVPGTVVNYEWDERSRDLLVWFITDTFANHTRESAGKQFNSSSNPKQ